MHSRRSWAHDQGLVHTHARAWEGLSRQASLGGLCDKDFSVAIGFGYSVLRHSLGVATRPGLWALLRQARAQRTRQKSSIATENSLNSLS